LVRVGHTYGGSFLSEQLSVWDVTTRKRLQRWRLDEIPHIYDLLHFTPDSRTVLIGGTTQLQTLDVMTGKQGKHKLDGLGLESDSADCAHCYLSPNGKTLAVAYTNIRGEGTLSNAVLLWDWTTGKKIGQLDLQDGERVLGWHPASFSPDGKRFATA